jgi:hypothetical protein
MIIGMTLRECLRRYQLVGFISFVDRKRDPEGSQLRVWEKPEARR